MIDKLNIGCGSEYFEGYVNVDISDVDVYNKSIKVDVKHDLDVFPYPFKDNSFREIRANAIIEHLKDRMKVWHELKRISKDGCIIKATVPHFSGVVLYDDPTHYQGYTTKTAQMIADTLGFRIIKNKILVTSSPYLRFLTPLVNIAPRVYEKTISGIIRSNCMYWEFEVVK